LGDSDAVAELDPVIISGFPGRGDGEPQRQTIRSEVSAKGVLPAGYGIAYRGDIYGGMSGGPVVDRYGKVVAVHGMSDRRLVDLYDSGENLLLSQQRIIRQAEERVQRGVLINTFKWGIPINTYLEYRPAVAMPDGAGIRELQEQVQKLEKALADAQGQLEQTDLLQAPGRANTLEKELAETQGQLQQERKQRQQAEGNLLQVQGRMQSLEKELAETQGQLQQERKQRQQAEGNLLQVQGRMQSLEKELYEKMEEEAPEKEVMSQEKFDEELERLRREYMEGQERIRREDRERQERIRREDMKVLEERINNLNQRLGL
jgi:DNA repair exonuclease SbcCD ATPase subunit